MENNFLTGGDNLQKIILASKSPRREELLKRICKDFKIEVSDVDEDKISADTPQNLAQNIAAAKAQAVFGRNTNSVVIGCDTVVEIGGKVFGKPKNREDAVQTLKALSGKTHSVHTGVSIISADKKVEFVSSTLVSFEALTDEEIDEYILTGEPFDKAGSYGIQGAGGKFVNSINGCYYNVMGLPISAVYKHIKDF